MVISFEIWTFKTNGSKTTNIYVYNKSYNKGIQILFYFI